MNLKLNPMKKLVLFLIVGGLLATSCSDDDSGSSNATLSLSLSGMEDLGADFAYEGWVIVDGSPVTTGTFSVDANGTLSQLSLIHI